MSQDDPAPTDKVSLRNAFPGYFPPNDELLERFLTVGVVVLDANALLDTYKFTGTARREFLDALRALDDRLFIPHQVALEFMRNRATVIKAGCAFPSKFREAAKKLHSEVQALKEHRRLQDEEVSGIKSAIDAAIEDILKRHADLYDDGVTLDKSVEYDPVFKEIEQITEGKVGPPFAKRDEMAKVGNQRFKEKIPPGYSDHDKEAHKALGDYFLWEQTIIKASERQLPVLIVSNENKEDWVRKEDRHVRGPRPEMVDELLVRASQPFHLVNVKTFLTYARTYLRAKVSDSTIEQAESVGKQAEETMTVTLHRWRGQWSTAGDARDWQTTGRFNPPAQVPDIVVTPSDARVRIDSRRPTAESIVHYRDQDPESADPDVE
jgi:hypothetical protein